MIAQDTQKKGQPADRLGSPLTGWRTPPRFWQSKQNAASTRSLSNTSRFNEVGKESHGDRGEAETDGDDDLSVHRAAHAGALVSSSFQKVCGDPPCRAKGFGWENKEAASCGGPKFRRNARGRAVFPQATFVPLSSCHFQWWRTHPKLESKALTAPGLTPDSTFFRSRFWFDLGREPVVGFSRSCHCSLGSSVCCLFRGRKHLPGTWAPMVWIVDELTKLLHYHLRCFNPWLRFTRPIRP